MRRILAIVVLALSALLGLPATAHAGGPTSVLVTQPGAGAGALYYSDPAYDALTRLLPEAETRGKAEPPGYGGDDYTLTWMVHDVSPWRWDRVHVAGDGTAWVSTTMTPNATPQWEPIGPAKQLTALIDGVLGEAGGPVVVSLPAEDPAAEPAAAPAAEDVGSSWLSLSGWRWLVPGVLLGLLVGAVATHRRGADEQRQVLVTSDA